MKYVRINNNLVVEVIPEEATIPSVAYWYGDEFASQCVEAPDEVEQNWVFDSVSGNFVEPSLEPEKLEESDLQSDMAELLIDLAYRTTLLELGVSI